MIEILKSIWKAIRRLSGDDAYERYLAHYAEHHAQDGSPEPPLGKEEFFRQWQDSKWKGIKRCC
jgi:uncharacterized short protein YbdD (DUF466 family)